LQEANAAFLSRRGYTSAEAKGLNVADWEAKFDRQEIKERMRKLVGRSAVFETRHRCKDGSVFDVEVCATGVQIGEEQLLFCVTRDITERKQAEDQLRRSEEKFKTLFGLAPVGISVLDPQYNVVDVNPALEKITRLSREELLNGSWRRRTYLNADGTPMQFAQLASQQAVNENRPINPIETGIVTESGEILWTQVSAAPLDLLEASAVVITQDITERKRAAEALEGANHQLRGLSRQLFHLQEEERRHLARELHDEIGQNLTAAKMNLEMISPHVPAKVTGRLEDSVQLLDRLLVQVRQLSLALRPALLDELGLVPTLRWLVEQQAKRAGLRTRFHAPEPFEKLGSEIQTVGFRIVQEAITNVLRHAHARSVSIHLEIVGDQLRIKIVDDGNGFELAEVERRAHDGLGFGLIGMRERAALVGGQVQIISSPNKGTSVEVSLPLNGDGEDPIG
jgi:PAS domain S-box-containing protein